MDVPPELKEQADLEWRLAKRQRIMSRVLLQKIPLRLQAAQLPQGDLISSIPDVALRCYADGPQFLRRLVYRLCDLRPNIMDNSSSPIECPVQLTERIVREIERRFQRLCTTSSVKSIL